MVRKKIINKGETLHIKDDGGFIDNDFKEKPSEDKDKIEEVKDKKERIDILKKFAKELLKKYGHVVRSVVLFGSTAREEWKGKSDIDVFVIIDDTRQKITPMAKDKIDAEMVKISKDIHSQLSVQQPYLLTEFWNMVRLGHPIVFNFIREGVPVYDKDTFLPIKRLLQMGEIKPSKEAVEKYIERAPRRIKRVENAKIYMVVEDCYYAMMESAQAVLMFLGESPPRPSDAAEALERSAVKIKLLEPKYAEWLKNMVDVRKDVEHRKKQTMPGGELDSWIKKTKQFVKRMQQLIVRIEVMKRENIIDKSYSIMEETTITLLQALKKTPKKKKITNIEKLFESELVKTGLISENYLYAFRELKKLKKMTKDGKSLDLPKQHILLQREYVRKFIREVGKILKERANNE
ncbi:MAG: nucleotidyltransferase domain-containing protein [Candidatus Aenigmatarchaeota archaeon]|nr:MAG: nucleotidyltransferase domain-containing protein [Candidatus Aenigmarchaeota archaeon]